MAFGAINLDCFYSVPRLQQLRESFPWWPLHGEKVVTGAQLDELLVRVGADPGVRFVHRGGGGQAANFALAVERCGVPSTLLGVVGNHDGADFVLADLGGVTLAINRNTARTDQAVVLVEASGERDILLCPGANEMMSANDVDQAILSTARHVHFTSFSGEKQFDLQVAACLSLPKSVPVSMDIGALYAQRGLKALQPLLSRTTFLFATADELRTLQNDDVEQAVRAVLGAGVDYVCCKRGPLGARIYGADDTMIEEKVPPTRALDSTGAGDLFAGVFVAAHLLGIPPKKSLIAAVTLASKSVTGWGRTCYPSRAQCANALSAS